MPIASPVTALRDLCGKETTSHLVRAARGDEDCLIGVLLKVPGLNAFLLLQHGPVLARQVEGLQQQKPAQPGRT